MSQRIDEKVRLFAAIEAEGHFLKIGREMLCANMVPSSHDATLQKRERGFDGVRVNVALNVDFHLMANRLVLSLLAEFPGGAAVGQVLVRKEHVYIFADIFRDVLFESAALDVLHVKKTEIAAALADSDYDFLVVETRGLTTKLHPSADIGFVHFDFAVKHRLVGLNHSRTDSMTEIPCGLIADSKRPLNLASRNSLFRFAEKIGRRKPLFEWEMGVVEDRPGGYGELIAA